MISQIRERMRLEESPLKYPTSPATLLQFAATRLALDLYIIKHGQNCPEGQFNCENILQVSLPTRIKNVIDERVESVGRKMLKICHHFNKLHSTIEDGNQSDDARFFESVTYGPDGNISFELTAKKLLSNDRLNLLEKFGIACVYSFEDDIRRIWPTVSNLARFEDAFVFDTDRVLVRYWVAHMGRVRRLLPPYPHMMACLRIQCKYWTTFKYVLNRIHSFQQYRCISAFLRSGRFKNAKYMLPKLNRIQMRYVLQHHAGDIIAQLVVKEKYIDFVMQIWSLAKECISDGQFLHLIRALCRISYKCSSQNDCDKSAHVRIALNEIWTSAPNSLKYEIFNSNFGEKILNDLENFDRENQAECYHHDMKFFLQLFQDMPFEMRNSLWLRYWLVFVVRYRAAFLSSFLKICMRNEEIPRFAESVMLDFEMVGSFLDSLFKRQYYEDVMDYLKICSTNDGLVREMGREMIQKRNKLPNDPQFDKFTELSKFIDGCFADSEEVMNFKARFYFSQQFQNLLEAKLKCGVANDQIRITELFLYSQPDVVYAKRNLLEYWRRCCLDSKLINFYHCNEFLSWCIADTNNVPGSNRDFPVDRVFEILLMDAVPKLTYLLGPLELSRFEPDPMSTRKLDEFNVVDAFLAWYFATPEGKREFKLDKIRSQDIPGVKKVLSMKNESVINDVLSWFFDGDLDQVKNFKSKLNNDKGDCAKDRSEPMLE